MAPHEFFPLFARDRLRPPTLARLLSEVYVLNVEQPGGQWFEIASGYGRRARGAIDISRDGAHELLRRGVDATVAPLGYAPMLECESLDRHTERPIDVLFLGHSSPRRDEFLARHADVFSAFNCHFVLTDLAAPRRLGTSGYHTGLDRLRLLASSKILVNVHSSDRTYFETHRALLALANNCLFVSELSRESGSLQSGVHFVMASIEEIPAVCRRYLQDPQALRAIASEGHAYVKSQLTMKSTCQSLIRQLDELEREAHGRNGAHEPARLDRQRARRRIARQIREDAGRRTRGERTWDLQRNSAYVDSSSPSVAVVVTLYNYASYIQECLLSVLSAEAVGDGVEVIVVDDGSTDESLERATALANNAAMPILIVRKHSNTGLADARNVGLSCARANAVFILDADNWIYPRCLRLLYEALRAGTCAGVYSLIRRFDHKTQEALGLMSRFDWDVTELIRSPYIDAMAMMDREAVLSVGGYSTELIDHGWFGWEDYDLWLKLAAAGFACRLVPNVLSSYRAHERVDAASHQSDNGRHFALLPLEVQEPGEGAPGLGPVFRLSRIVRSWRAVESAGRLRPERTMRSARSQARRDVRLGKLAGDGATEIRVSLADRSAVVGDDRGLTERCRTGAARDARRPGQRS